MTNRTELNTPEGEMKKKAWTPGQIKTFRLSLKLTQRELGARMGVTNRYVCMLEKGMKKPGPMFKLFLDCLEGQEAKKRKGVIKE